jgi:hypothetical protein
MSSISTLSQSINRFDQSDCPFEAGTEVPHTGLYEVCHKDEARVAVVLMRGERFRECQRCGSEVRYRLVRAAPHISEDPDFEAAS